MDNLQVRIRMRSVLAVSVICINMFALAAMAEEPYQIAWSSQLGTSSNDSSLSVAVDISGNTYLSGYTEGSLGGTNAGGRDAFLAKYNPVGNLLWTKQLGTSNNDLSMSVKLDGPGNVYISGYTRGSLFGAHAGMNDAFLAKYDPAGNQIWTKQLGTSKEDRSISVAVHGSGNIYISGYTDGNLGGTNAGSYDAFLAKYDSVGNLLWTEQLGTSGSDFSHSVAVDASGNAYIGGSTYRSLGGPSAGGEDAFLAKYNSAGNLLWIEQFGTNDFEYTTDVAVDTSGNILINGSTGGSLGGTSAGSRDTFLAKYDPEGSLLWTEQIGTSTEDHSESMAVDGFGNAFISGFTDGSLGGDNAGVLDVFLAKYDPAGTLLWVDQFGTVENDFAGGIAVDSFGNAYFGGSTYGNIGGPNVGGYDAFLVKFAVPEPGTLCLLAVGGAALVRRRRA